MIRRGAVALDGEITEAVSKITWSGGQIAPGNFQRFPVSMGPLPDVDSLQFKAVQTYSSGETVRWIEAEPTDGTEAEHPAPTLTLAPAQEDATSVPADATSTDDDDSAKTIGYIALGVGAIGVVLGAVALVRRRPASS